MVSLHLPSQQERVVLGFGSAAPLLTACGAYLLLHGNDTGVPPAAGLVLVLLSLPLAAVTVVLGFRPLMSGTMPWLLRTLVTANLLILAAIAAFAAYQMAMILSFIVEI